MFQTERELQGAYDFLENDLVPPEEVTASLVSATLDRCEGLPFVYVPVDGTSISVADHTKVRDFGNVGSTAQEGRGLKVVDALAVDPNGTVIGWLALTYWARQPTARNAMRDTHARQARPVDEKETRYWIQSVKAVAAALDERGLRGWLLIDREGDGRDLLLALRETQHWWTVRASSDRSVELEEGDLSRLRLQMSLTDPVDTYPLEVSGRPGRKKRVANMVVRVAKMSLRLRDRATDKITVFEVTSVWAREEGTTPKGEAPIDWLLHTNREVKTTADARLVVFGYAQRWRVEECHKTWKTGDCDIEATQLRSFKAVQIWATILAAVATRVERLKRLGRSDDPILASEELSPLELKVLEIRGFANERNPIALMTLQHAVRCIAEMGGWAGKYSGKPPGSIVLARGLQRLHAAAQLLRIQQTQRG